MTKYRCTKFDEFQGFMHVGGEGEEGKPKPKSTSKPDGCVFLHSKKLGVDNEGFCKEDI